MLGRRGRGRRKHWTNQVPEHKSSLQPPSLYRENVSITARNLQLDHLGGMIFTCTDKMMDECLRKQLFGLSFPHYSYVKNVKPGLLLFLFNHKDRKLYGIYEAASPGQMNIDLFAWTGDGSKTNKPAQVHFHVKTQCLPLDEKQYKRILLKNYYSESRFCLELDHVQINGLLALFKPLPVPKPLSTEMALAGRELPRGWASRPEKPMASIRWGSLNKFAPLILDDGCSSNTAPEGGDHDTNKESGLASENVQEGDLDVSPHLEWRKVAVRKQKQKCKPSVGLGNVKKSAAVAFRNTDAKEKGEMVTKRNLNMSEILEIAYGDDGVDVSIPEIDIIIEIRRARFNPRVVKEKVDEKEQEKIDKILEEIHRQSLPLHDLYFNPDNLPDGNFFLVEPREDIDCTYSEMTARSLDIYYKRLMPNVEYVRKLSNRCKWNRLPEVDSQYMRLFSKLWDHFDQKSWVEYITLSSSVRIQEDFDKAKEIAEDLQFRKLDDSDISGCLNNLFMERDNIARHKLRIDYYMYALEHMGSQDFKPEDFTPKIPPPASRKATYFIPRIHQRDFESWIQKENRFAMRKEECQKAIREYHEKKFEEKCSTRFRYLKFKRALAKDLGLISKETYEQEYRDYLNEESVGGS